MNIYKKYLLSREKKIGVWGTGYIGLSTMAYFAREKIESIGYDVDPKKVDDIVWNGKDLNNYSLPQGMYIYKLHVYNLLDDSKIILHNKLLKKL